MSYVLTKLLRAFGKDIEKMIMIRIKLMCKQAYPTHEGLKIKIETSTKQSIKNITILMNAVKSRGKSFL